jgi:hypothetical protein
MALITWFFNSLLNLSKNPSTNSLKSVLYSSYKCCPHLKSLIDQFHQHAILRPPELANNLLHQLPINLPYTAAPQYLQEHLNDELIAEGGFVYCAEMVEAGRIGLEDFGELRQQVLLFVLCEVEEQAVVH